LVQYFANQQAIQTGKPDKSYRNNQQDATV